MPMFLEVRSGSQLGRKIRVNPGRPVRIGRTTAADIPFSDDSHMSGLHFSVEYVDNQCRISDLNSRNGSFINGQRIATAILTAGDTLLAGETKFVLTQEVDKPESVVAASAPTAEFSAFVVPQTPQDHLLALLRDEFQPLFAILDAARDIRILALLLHHKEQCESLYEGEQGATLAQVAPYLVRLAKESPLLKALVKEGWGKSWGVYLTCPNDFEEVRRHLRHFLQVKLPSGEQVYFRFYDPRVMRVFLPTCTPEDATQFFGPIQNYLVEDETPEQLLRFVNTGQGSQKMLIALQDRDQRPKASTPEDEPPETEVWPEGQRKDEAS
jgi:pSer/pThr/pTyr-binding forkhead associated (FHA) protein